MGNLIGVKSYDNDNVRRINSTEFEITSFTDSSIIYKVNIEKNTCTCPAWKYHRKNIPTCKHLDLVRTAPDQSTSFVHYIKNKKKKCDNFHVISSYLPKTSLDTYVYSRKYDGIRIRFCMLDKKAITRKCGMSIDISSILPHTTNNIDDTIEFDAELLFEGNFSKGKTGHDMVMKELTNNRIHNLTIKVFDIIDRTKTFEDRLIVLKKCNLPTEMIVDYKSAYNYQHLQSVMISYKKLHYEGIVVRNMSGLYTSGKMCNRNAFKIKVNNIRHKITDELLEY